MFFYNIKRWWDTHGWGIIFIGSLLVLFFLWLFYSRHREAGTSNATADQILQTFLRRPSPTPMSGPTAFRAVRTAASPSPTPSISPTSKGEQKCKEFIEFMTGKKFNKVRPEFLTNPVTGHTLELDLYNDELKLAIEYNGAQHYKYNSMMHGSRDSFHNQKYRDLIKKQLCEQNGVRLIEVPYTVPEHKIPDYLYGRVKALL